MKTVPGPLAGADADAVTHIAVALTTAKLSISGSATRPRSEVAVPLTGTPSSPLQAEGRPT